MADIIAEIVSALRNQQEVVLATIISSSGSTPLPPGAKMLLKEQGSVVLGTIGGGSVEANVAREAEKLFADRGRCVVRRFELDEMGSEEGMICGGSVEVLIESFGQEELAVFSRLLDARDEGADCMVLRSIDVNKKTAKRSVLEGVGDAEPPVGHLENLLRESGISSEQFIQNVRRAHREETVQRIAGLQGEIVLEPIVGLQPLIVFGGGHIGRSLSKIAAAAGFTVTIVDDRPEYAQRSRFPDASRILAENFSEAFNRLKIGPAASIVIATRGHDSDRQLLERAVSTPARYIGMIGSARKVAATYAVLQKNGTPVSSLRRVHAPIGLDIGAITAEEIAVSIVAELIRTRRGIPSASEQMSSRMDRWFGQAEAGPHDKIER
jgi:xanthine dehydrogenase accessory factor